MREEFNPPIKSFATRPDSYREAKTTREADTDSTNNRAGLLVEIKKV